MSEVSDEHPGRRVADASEEGHCEHEPPALAQRTSQRVGAEQPHTCPQAEHEGVVLNAAWNPLAPEFLVALTTCTLVGEVHPPLQGEEGAGIVQAEEMDNGDEGDGEQVLVPVGTPGSGPLLEGVVELLGVPAELALDEQVNRRGMMPVVLQDELFPRQAEKVSKWMCQEALPLVNWEGGAMHHVVINVNVLDGDVREREAEAERAGPPVVREASQGCTVADHHRHLRTENCGKDIPPSSWQLKYKLLFLVVSVPIQM